MLVVMLLASVLPLPKLERRLGTSLSEQLLVWKEIGPSLDEFVEYMISNTKMQWVSMSKFVYNEILLIQGTR